ncbi:MAG TPA: ThuA domain-containing protein [Bryobacteraceae bacterium]|nr:ThuA domain-containing protein [Bryobacteraceae bacterium]HOL72616.1 ThuA domain-containing protein [Bryobacteraceae bacterium]HOQ45967.1 ThuA domain-containing protein [Bryobacteraceae bacterium]HPQ15507.1 ThuA domain-containing protein [Bryobacteraceae bacterium]HPU73822.1 ThuA domain-containing protein [Bryobacteraceae bacterium]
MKRIIPVCLGAVLCASVALGQRRAQFTPEQMKLIEEAVPKKAVVKPKKPRRLLVTSLCMSGDKIIPGHPSIQPGKYALQQMAKSTGAFEVVLSDDVEMFRPEKLKEFDAICFNNTQGVIIRDPALQDSIYKFITGGGGFVGFHAAVATINQYPKFDVWPWYSEMLGGTESGGHPWMPRDSFFIKVDDPKSPLTAAFKGQGFEIVDEVFQLQEPNLRDRFRVLLSIDMEKSKPSRPPLPIRQKDNDFPLTWIRTEGKGRVFYSGLGHNPHIFWHPVLLEHFLAGIQYALGDLEADATPSSKIR